MRRFLTAIWKDLVLVNYEVEPELLSSRVPRGTELDLHEGRCFVSLVGFMFLDTRVSGVHVPCHVDFEEVNLRFYVTREVNGEIRRAVCFVKEIVPRWAIAAVAKRFYGEPYEAWKMYHARAGDTVSYEWSRNGVRNRLEAQIGETAGIPAAGSHEEFIIEHYWGYTARSEGRVDEYRVEHQKWELHTVTSDLIEVDFAATYGIEFAELTTRVPYSVLFAAGSQISVYKGRPIS